MTQITNIDPYALAKAIALVQNGWCQETQLPSGDFYQGDLRNNAPHGRGTLKYMQPNEKKCVRYEGEFVNGVPHGLGKMFWADGSVYQGAFENDQMDGQGTLTYVYEKNTKTIKHGEWKNGLMDGRGVMSVTVTMKSSSGHCFHSTVDTHTEEYIRRSGVFKNGCLWEGESKMGDGIFRYVNGERQQANKCVIF